MDSLFIVYLDLGIGGIQRKIVDFVNYLSKYKPNLPIYIILRNKTSFDLSKEINNKRVKIFNFQDISKIKLPFLFPLYVLIKVLKYKPSSILSFLDHASISVIFAKKLVFWRNIKLIISEDHYTPTIVSTLKFGKIRHYLIRIFYPVADVIFTCSEANKKALTNIYKIKSNKIQVVANWTMLSRVYPKNTKRKKYDITYVGRIAKTKRLDLLINSIPEINKKMKRDIKVLIVGEGPEKGNLIKLTQEKKLNKNIIFIKTKHNIQKYLKRSKIFVYTSYKKVEGLPMAILEAMALKIPTLSSNFAGIEEFFTDRKECFLFDSQKDFIRQATYLLKNKKIRDELGKNARLTVTKNHSPRNMISYIKELETYK